MDALLTPSGAAQLRDMLLDTSEQGMLVNSMLLTPSVSDAFRNGHLQVRLRGRRDWEKFDRIAAEGASSATVSC